MTPVFGRPLFSPDLIILFENLDTGKVHPLAYVVVSSQ